MEKKHLKESNLFLAIFDLMPVIFFSITTMLLGVVLASNTFFIGAIFVLSAGISKVIWKTIIIIEKKDIEIINVIFKPLMIIGFILLIIGLIISDKTTIGSTWKNVGVFPGYIFFILGIVLDIVMFILPKKLDMNTAQAHWTIQWVNSVAQLSFMILSVLIYNGSNIYVADNIAKECLSSTDQVVVVEIDNGYLFDGPGNDAMIFYPGARVEYTAYAPLMKMFAENGIDCFLVEMPYSMAMYNINQANKILDEYDRNKWYMGGHSLGGAMASIYVSDNIDKFSGLVLLAAYTTKEIDKSGFVTVSLFGSEDTVLNKANLTNNSTMIKNGFLLQTEIKGANHAQFGSYGKQKNDSKAKISLEEQWKITVDMTLEQLHNPKNN